jgi:hypothetical protein
MNPFDLETSPEVEAAVRDLINHLVHAMSQQGMTLAELTVKDAEEVGQEVFLAHVQHGTLESKDISEFGACYRQALLMSTVTTNNFANDWE